MSDDCCLVLSKDAGAGDFVRGAIGPSSWEIISASATSEVRERIEADHFRAILVCAGGGGTTDRLVDLCQEIRDVHRTVPIGIVAHALTPLDRLSLAIAGAGAILEPNALSAKSLAQFAVRGKVSGGARPAKEDTYLAVREAVGAVMDRRMAPPRVHDAVLGLLNDGFLRGEAWESLLQDPVAAKLADPLEAAGLGPLLPTCVFFAHVAIDSRPARLLRFFHHAISCGAAARHLALALEQKEREEEAFFAGLLHEIGLLFLLEAVPELYEDVIRATHRSVVDLGETEREALGVSHNEVSAWAFEVWRLPTPLPQTVRKVGARRGEPGKHMRVRLLRAARSLCWESPHFLRIKTASPTRGAEDILEVDRETISRAREGLRADVETLSGLLIPLIRARQSTSGERTL